MRTDRPCRDNPDLWFADMPGERGQAIHICREHCTRLVECRQLPPVQGGVQGGVYFGSSGEPATRQPRPVRCEACRLPTSPVTVPVAVLKPPADTGACGEVAGYSRHRRRGQHPCGPCGKAHSTAVAARRAKRRFA